jgi:hypothetical protein
MQSINGDTFAPLQGHRSEQLEIKSTSIMATVTIDLSERSGYLFYSYTPKKWVAITCTVSFLLALGFQIYWVVSAEKTFKYDVAYKHRRRYIGIMIPLMIGVLLEAIGYTFRVISANNPEWLAPYAVQMVMLFVAPKFIVATIYMCSVETIRRLKAEKYSIVPIRYLTKIFVLGDISSFIIQSSGGGLMVDSAGVAKKLIVIGLLVQVAFYGCFIISMALFAYRINSSPTEVSSSLKHTRPTFGNWTHGLAVLVISSVFILIRSIYLVVESMQGMGGYLRSHEVFLFVFDSVSILVTVILLETNNFTRFFCSSKAEDSDFHKEIYGRGKKLDSTGRLCIKAAQ